MSDDECRGATAVVASALVAEVYDHRRKAISYDGPVTCNGVTLRVLDDPDHGPPWVEYDGAGEVIESDEQPEGGREINLNGSQAWWRPDAGMEGCTPEQIDEAYERARAFLRGDWGFVGIEVQRGEQSSALWGVETDYPASDLLDVVTTLLVDMPPLPPLPPVWIVLRDLEGGQPEVDVFASEEAAQEHWERLVAGKVQPDVFAPREEQVAREAWMPTEAE